MKQRFFSRWGLFALVFLALVVVTYLVADRFDTRVDLTDNKVHTISEETRQILSGLKDIVTIEYYVSENMPWGFHNLARDTIERLREYERIAKGKVRIQVIDPDRLVSDYVQSKEKESKDGKQEEEDLTEWNPFTGGGKKSPREEKLAELRAMGIPQLQGRSIKDDRFELVPFFSAILIKYLEKQPESIPAHASLESMEYELANRIIKLTTETKPKFAFLLGKKDDFQEIENQYAPGMPPTKMHPYEPLLEQVFGEKFEVNTIELSESSPIPEDVNLLLIAEPNALSDRQAFEIDRFLAKGGTLLLLMSRATCDLPRGSMQISPLTPRLDKLLEGWGVRQGQDLVCSTECGTVIQRRRASNLPFEINQAVPVAVIPMAPSESLSQQSPLTQGLQALLFPFASPLYSDQAKLAANSLKLTVLAKSVDKTWLRPWAPQLNEEMIDPPTDRNGDPIFTGSVDLAYMIEGTFPNLLKQGDPIPAWPKPPKEEGKDEKEPEEPAPAEDAGVFEPTERKPARVIICASGDMAKVQYLQMQEYQANIPFFLNTIESVALGQGLVNIRAKTQTARPLETLSRTEKNLISGGNLLVVPLLVGLLGIIRWALRSAAASRYERDYLARTRAKEGS